MSEADDVLDFINSLPDSKSGTPHPQGDTNNEELLDFLDELAGEEKPTTEQAKPVEKSTQEKEKPKPKDKKKMTAKKEGVSTSNDAATAPVASTTNESPETKGDSTTTTKEASESKSSPSQPQSSEAPVDVVNAISSWWGSGKGLLGSLATNAQHISEQTYQNASNLTNELNRKGKEYLNSEESALDHLPKPDINSLGARLNSLLSNVSSQITQGLMSEDDELLNILLVYDAKLKYLDSLVSAQFKQVMEQVEGGIAVNVTSFNHSNLEGVDDSKATDLSMFYGKSVDGDKLCYANLESSIKDYHRIAEESAEKQRHLEQIELNQSNLFVCIQPICTNRDTTTNDTDSEIVTIDGDTAGNFTFTVVLKDITNDITIATKTQPFPLKWAQWLNGEDLDRFGNDGDIDPAQWVRDWIRKGLDLSFGVLAQEYVIRRMGY